MTVTHHETEAQRAATGELFRRAFRSHPAGISIVTAMVPASDDGAPAGPVGITASSVASVAVDPAVLSFSVSGGRSARRLLEADHVVVHLVAAEQLDAVQAFATPGAERFAEGEWYRTADGDPVLAGVPWALRCRILERLPIGGSVLVAAEVLEVLEGAGEGTPLVYRDGAFHTATPL
ncbi:flavin reductase family protein [Zhihengliuella sp.]|uniref:flavin reductase family protein n=1 Tax=Zhihengliuella sp. TaxID=1954483 RepID=UPI0028115528|nr:flavin reductase family protein [Zhihengliuella sp.]